MIAATRPNRKSADRVNTHIPTPAEIRAACRAIQQEWTDEERNERRVGSGSIRQLTTAMTAQELADSIHN